MKAEVQPLRNRMHPEMCSASDADYYGVYIRLSDGITAVHIEDRENYFLANELADAINFAFKKESEME